MEYERSLTCNYCNQTSSNLKGWIRKTVGNYRPVLCNNCKHLSIRQLTPKIEKAGLLKRNIKMSDRSIIELKRLSIKNET